MKHEITTLNTKRTLAASLRKFMEKKPLNKITVSEIIADCGVNRKTFYYHFDGIYALLKWMLDEEAIEVVKQFDLPVNYREAVLFVLNYVHENKQFLCCAYDGMGRDELKRFFYNDFIGITQAVIRNTEHQLGVHTTEEFKEQSGELWVWLFENLQFKYEKAMESLYDNVIYVEAETTTAEETTAAEDTETTAETTETTAAN